MAKMLRQNFHKFYALWENYNKTSIFENNPETFAQRNHYFSVTHPTSVEKFDQSERRRTLQNGQIKMIFGGPHQKQNEITKEYARIIREAKEEIVIANLYFCPVEPIFKALIDAVKRNVKLTVITNGVSAVAPSYTKFFCWANRIHYLPLFYGKTFHFWHANSLATLPIKNTHIFEYHVRDILLHKKMMIVDDKISIIGSYNLGPRSDLGDYELILEIDSKEVASDLRKVHEKDLKYSREISVDEACEWYFDPFILSLGEIQKRFHGLL
jgi:phosphatidylserine/phosphatidylglycerophosphate/cardiolipin synthase-like enzyme